MSELCLCFFSYFVSVIEIVMKLRPTLLPLFLLFFVIGFTLRVHAQISITALGTPYTENFNTLAMTSTATAVPTNWGFLEVGSNANTVYTAGTGSSTTGDTYSFGLASNSERAWGGLNSGSMDSVIIGAQYTNNTGSTIGSITITYTGEQWRKATGRLIPDTMFFSYSTNATSLSQTSGTWNLVSQLHFLTPSANYGGAVSAGLLDGNLTANQQVISFSITGLSIANGQSIWLRWFDTNIGGTDDGMAIDDVSVVACAGTPSSAISGAATICSGANTTLSVSYNGGQPWSFTYTDGTTPVNVTGITNTPYTFNVTPANNTTYTVSSFNGPCGVPTITTASQVVTVSTVAGTATISGNQTICSTTSTSLTNTLTGVSPWAITYTDGTTPVTVTGITNAQYIVSITPAASVTYTLTNSNDFCGASTIGGSGISVITVDPSNPPTATLSGNNSICLGASANLTVALTNGTPWAFTYTDGTANQTITGETASSRLISITPTATTTYSLVSVSNNICSGSTSGTAVVVVRLLPTVSLTATQSICAGATAQLTFALTGTSPWSLTYSVGTVVVNQTGITSSPYLVTVTPTASTTYLATNIADAFCNLSASSSAVVTVASVPSASISGTQTICTGTATQLTVSLVGVSPWDFTYSDGANLTTITGTTSSSYLINLTPGANVTYTLTSVSNDCAGSITGSPAVITVNTPPSATLSGSASLCSGDSTLLTVTLLSSLTPYSIDYSDGVNTSTITGITSSTYSISVSPSATTTYTLTSISDPGVCAGSVLGNAVVVVLPSASAALSGDQTICAGSAANLNLNLNGSLPWNVVYSNGTNNITLNGITSTSYTISVTPLATTTYSLVSVMGANCSGSVNGAPVVTVNPLPAPVITGSQTLTVSGITGTATYQWELNGSPISGATNNTFNPITSGTYSLVVTQNGCTGTSNSLVVVVSGLDSEWMNADQFSVYPNPSKGIFEIKGTVEILSVTIFDVNGKQEQAITLQQSLDMVQVNMSNAPSGVYFVKIATENGLSVNRVSIQ